MSITGSNNLFACNPVVFANANSIVSLGTITRDGNQFTFSVGFVWKINGVTYQNTAPVVITITEASTGFQRIDNALLNTSNTIELQQGLESDTIALRPIAPDTNIILTSWNISGSDINDSEPPIIGTHFKKKSESAAYNDPTLSGSDAVIPLQPNGQSVYAFSNAGLTSIDGFGLDLITGNPSAEVPYPGKDIFIFNNKSGNLTLKHDGSGTAQCKFFFIDETDLIIPPGGKVWLKYGPSYCELIFKSWSDVYDVIEGYFNGTNFYTDALFTDLITPESGKIYVALDTNFTYRWGGSAYVQIGGEQQNYKVITKNVVDSSVVTGTTSYVTLYTFNIPANTFQVGDLIGIKMRSLKTGTLGAMNASAFIGSWNVVFQSVATSRFNSFDRTAVIKSASVTEELTSTTNVAITAGAIVQNHLMNIDWTISQTLNIRLQLFNSADSAVVSFFELYRIR